ncbi:MAG: Mur ligase family protein [Rickettsiaceae bacterium]
MLPKNLIAITGTNGKTSTVSYCQQLLNFLGHDSVGVGTLGINLIVKGESDIKESGFTTPPISVIQESLKEAYDLNIKYCLVEASSHGIHQKRLGDIKFHIAAFTSFSNDHLDYHNGTESYLTAKLALFKNQLAKNGCIVLQSDLLKLDLMQEFIKDYSPKILSIGKNGDVVINEINSSINDSYIRFTYQNKKYSFTTKIFGDYQISNLMIAIFILHKLGFSLNQLLQHTNKLRNAKGRMELITDLSLPFKIFIDYAHTPDALEQTLNALLRQLKSPGRLKILFGCGGDRDKSKRSEMGAIAAKIAHQAIITDDNPRYENPEIIRAQILSGIITNTANVIEMPDRADAIKFSVKNLSPNDILLIAGKGHEHYQIIGDNKIEFDDAKIAIQAIKDYKL